MTIDFVIAHQDDWKNLELTIASAHKTDVDRVIVVDDCSSYTYFGYTDFGYDIKTPQPSGPAFAREMGVAMSTADVIVLTDAHMTFPPDWRKVLERAFELIGDKALICSPYRSDKPFPAEWHQGQIVTGARMSHLSVKWHTWSVCDMWPIPQVLSGDFGYQVPCVVGAFYAMKRSYYNELGGLKGLFGYGGDEQLLSWKVWLNGGTVAVIPGLNVIHHDALSIRKQYDPLLYLQNQLYVNRLVMGDARYSEFLAHMSSDVTLHAITAGGREIPEFYRHNDPDSISRFFEMQSIHQATMLAGEIGHNLRYTPIKDITPEMMKEIEEKRSEYPTWGTND